MIRYFTEHPTAANLMMVAFLVLGASGVTSMKRETLPALEADKVGITVVYRGATAEEVEDALCRRLEDAIEGVNDLEEMRCEAREGQASATAVKREGASMTRFLDDIKGQVEAITDLPDDAELPTVTELGRTERVISVAVTGIDDALGLRDYALALEARLARLPDVDSIAIRGFSDRELRVTVPSWRLDQFGLSVGDVAGVVRRQSVSAPAGTLEGDAEDAIVRFDTRARTVDALGELPVVSGPGGAEVRLGALARIEDRFADDWVKVYFDGRRAALLDVSKTTARDALTVLDQVRAFVEEERRRLPPGVALTLTQDGASVIRERLDLLVTNGIQGLVLVFLILWLFFSMRYGFWVAMGLPVSFLGGLYVLSLTGVSLNMISMVGLLIGIGLLMDDAIVIAENIARHLRAGRPPYAAAADGAREVFPGVASSFVTTVLIFGALAFLSGEIGQILGVLPVVLIVVLAVSLIEAFLILPSHLAHSLAGTRADAPATGLRALVERGFDYFTRKPLAALLGAAIRHRYATLGLVAMLIAFAVAVMAGGRIGFIGFPIVEGDIIEARVLLPQGTPLARTEAVVARLDEALAEVNERFRERQPGRQDLVRHRTVIFGENPDAYETGPHVARFVVDLLGAEQRDAALTDVIGTWREATGRLADVIALKFAQPAIGPAGRAIDIRLHGDDLERLRAAAGDLERYLGEFDGVVDLGNDLRPGKRELAVTLRPGAGALGFDARAVSDELRSAFQGTTIDEFPLGPESYEVRVVLAAADRRGPGNLARFRVSGADGASIPLKAVAEVRESRGWARIHRVDGQRTVTVQGDVDTRHANAQAIVSLTARTFLAGLAERYPDVRFALEGENKSSAETGRSLMRNALLGLVGVYLILAFQFRSYVLPIGVMLVIPTALTGVVAGHWLAGLDISMPSLVGMTSLAGIVVNNAILLVQFIERERMAGSDVERAALDAGLQRFRPILLSTLTTVAGLAPLLAETSRQAQVLIPLAVSLAFGLAAATVFALVMVPAYYCAVADFSRPDTDGEHAHPGSADAEQAHVESIGTAPAA